MNECHETWGSQGILFLAWDWEIGEWYSRYDPQLEQCLSACTCPKVTIDRKSLPLLGNYFLLRPRGWFICTGMNQEVLRFSEIENGIENEDRGDFLFLLLSEQLSDHFALQHFTFCAKSRIAIWLCYQKIKKAEKNLQDIKSLIFSSSPLYTDFYCWLVSNHKDKNETLNLER